MIQSAILPWFPIVLAVALGGRFLGRPRAWFLGMACALFWIALTQASLGVAMWRDGWTVLSLIAGASAITLMGVWSGQGVFEAGIIASGNGRKGAVPSPHATAPTPLGGDPLDRFDEWLCEHRNDTDPWPAFGEFVREVLRLAAQASHIQIFRLSGDEHELVALHASDVLTGAERRSARQGIPGHVLTTGRTYVHGDAAQGALVHALAEDSGERIAWCFPVTMGVKRLGVIAVGRLTVSPDGARTILRATEQLVNFFWRMLVETQTSRSSAQRDPVTRVYTRPTFLRIAASALSDSYRQREPVTLVVVAVEGLRVLGDTGQWETADEVSTEIAATIRGKLRADDCMGRFDDSRFALLLRRVDSELANLIVGQLMVRIQETIAAAGDRGRSIRVRCGVAGSGAEQLDLRTLVSRALMQARHARETDVVVASDIPAQKPQSRRDTCGSSSSSATTSTTDSARAPQPRGRDFETVASADPTTENVATTEEVIVEADLSSGPRRSA